PAGGLTFADGVSDAGKYVELVADQDTLVLVSNCPQLNNPCNAYDPSPMRMLVWNL
ncbi:MAG TPA: urea carboxylase, partial [Planctomycetota bacterium]|nr:urea carboxylase [Planctomycetota bacterium]